MAAYSNLRQEAARLPTTNPGRFAPMYVIQRHDSRYLKPVVRWA